MSSVLTHLKTRNFPLYNFAAFLFLPAHDSPDFVLFKYPKERNNFLWIKSILLAAPGISKTLIGEEASDFFFQKNKLTLRACFRQHQDFVLCIVIEASASDLIVKNAVESTLFFLSLVFPQGELKAVVPLKEATQDTLSFFFQTLFYSLLPFTRSSLDRTQFSGTSLSCPGLFLTYTLGSAAVTYRFSEQLLIDCTQFLNSVYDDLTSIDKIISFERHITYPLGVCFFFSGQLVVGEMPQTELRAIVMFLSMHDMFELEKQGKVLKQTLYFDGRSKRMTAVQKGPAVIAILLENYSQSSDQYDSTYEKRVSQALALMKDKGLFQAIERELQDEHLITNKTVQSKIFRESALEVKLDQSVVLPKRSNSIAAEEAKRGRAPAAPSSKLSHQHLLSTSHLRSSTPKADRNRSVDMTTPATNRLPEQVLSMAQKRSASSQKRYEKQLAKFSKLQAERTAQIQRKQYFHDYVAQAKVDPLTGLELYYSAVISQYKALAMNVQVGRRGHYLLFHKMHLLASQLLGAGKWRAKQVESANELDEQLKKGLSKQELVDILYRLDHSKRKPNIIPFQKAVARDRIRLAPMQMVSTSFFAQDKNIRLYLCKSDHGDQEEEDLNPENRDIKLTSADAATRWVMVAYESKGEKISEERGKLDGIIHRLSSNYFYGWE